MAFDDDAEFGLPTVKEAKNKNLALGSKVSVWFDFKDDDQDQLCSLRHHPAC